MQTVSGTATYQKWQRGLRGLVPFSDSPSDHQQPPHLQVCTLDALSTVWTHLPFGAKGWSRKGKKLRTHTAFFKIYCIQNRLSFAFSVARHYHKPFIVNHFSRSIISVINLLNRVNLFWRIVVVRCMISSEILFKPASEGLQTIIKGMDTLGHERNFLQMHWLVICLKLEICFQKSKPCCLSILFTNNCCC